VQGETSTDPPEDTGSPKGKPGFNGLTPREWTLHSKSVWTAREVSSPREAFHLEHGATFSIALAERAIRMYSAPNDLVLDPFVGTGTTVLAARNLGRSAVGFELYPKYVEMAKSRLRQTSLLDEVECRITEGDCLELVKTLTPESVQLTFTSPPYADFIHRSVADRATTHKHSLLVSENNSRAKAYGKDGHDFGNLPYDVFLAHAEELMAGIFRAMKPGGYNVWVVKDCRDPQQGKPFIEFHSDVAAVGRRVGFLYHDLIVWDQNDQRSLVLLGYPTTFYVNINHSFLVVLRRPKAA
jgi:DNA modification methylase